MFVVIFLFRNDKDKTIHFMAPSHYLEEQYNNKKGFQLEAFFIVSFLLQYLVWHVEPISNVLFESIFQ